MKFYFSDRQLAHQPTQYMVHGKLIHAFENANRAAVLIETMTVAGLTQVEPPASDLDPVLAVHADHFVEFLRVAHADFMALPNHGPEVLPNVHPYRAADAAFTPRGKPRTTGIIGRAGWYVGDLSAVIAEGTYTSVIASAEAAIAAARDVLAGAPTAFALCRPPGHHAYVDRASGFCFLNNAAIAAELLRKSWDRVAILDFDTHHGDGTQAIFYSRPDVFFGSVHTDPSAYYPHFIGYADETGAGAGEGANLNIPLPYGADDDTFVEANRQIIAAALARGSQALVLSAGWDAHHLDPLSKLAVTTDAYARIGELYGRLALPTVIIQEGGYSLEAIGAASRAFMVAFRHARGC
ncbi:MAG: putative acetylpolyamine [Beijerinckiaceae bacterium]|nr:MAG: putative acetylpolyamine [Beijerinckiaceae bacterium]